MELIFNKNVIKLKDDEEYIKETVNAVAIFHAKQKCDCKDNMPAHLKTSLNWVTKIKLTKIIKLLCSWYKTAGFNPAICKICWMHTQTIKGHIGLIINGLNYTKLYHRLYLIYNFCNQLGIIKTDLIIYSWFRKAYKPPVPSNSLKPYKFIYNLVLEFFYNKKALLNQMLSSKN